MPPQGPEDFTDGVGNLDPDGPAAFTAALNPPSIPVHLRPSQHIALALALAGGAHVIEQRRVIIAHRSIEALALILMQLPWPFLRFGEFVVSPGRFVEKFGSPFFLEREEFFELFGRVVDRGRRDES